MWVGAGYLLDGALEPRELLEVSHKLIEGDLAVAVHVKYLDHLLHGDELGGLATGPAPGRRHGLLAREGPQQAVQLTQAHVARVVGVDLLRGVGRRRGEQGVNALVVFDLPASVPAVESPLTWLKTMTAGRAL